jgi:hypothetical protein
MSMDIMYEDGVEVRILFGIRAHDHEVRGRRVDL